MMNNQFNTTNLTNQHGIQMAQHVASASPQTSPAVLNTFLGAQQQHQQQQQLAAAVASGSMYSDPRQLHLNSNSLDKNYYTATAATIGPLGTQRFYTTAGPAAATTNPTVSATGAHNNNTILINNFANTQPLSPEQQRNIRIITTAASPSATVSDMANATNGFQHSQNVFNLNNNKQMQHLFPQHLLHQQNFQPTHTSELLQQHFASQHFPPSHQQNLSGSSAIQIPQFYVSQESTIAPFNTNPKILTNIPTNNVASASGNSTGPLVSNGNNSNHNSSTVVLDRINICINNLYTDNSSSSSASNSLVSTPAQQPSPIIPAIQHKPIIENSHSLSTGNVYDSNTLVIDEPDSTTTATTPHTPPTTPENTPPSMPNIGNNNNNNNIITTTSSINSPSTSRNQQKLTKSNNITAKQSFASVAQNVEETVQYTLNAIENNTQDLTKGAQSLICQSNKQSQRQSQTTRNVNSSTPLTPPTPPSPKTTNKKEFSIESKQTPAAPPVLQFSNGEDVFIKRQDGRFYLGTVINSTSNQFLIRFDDKTELWCKAVEMRKFGSSADSAVSPDRKVVDQPMCVACKRSQPDSKVEICERCGRGYHRKCTNEISPGSEVWLCKRCVKPMKLDESSRFSSTEEETEVETCLKLHYDAKSLTWDDKHCVNEEQIYCYCGKSGRFDNNMLQCWRCLNWYHTHCIRKFMGNLLRGDVFFVFCCSVCNGGEEYLRRLQLSWVDLVHLVLYNLSTLKKHHKYHHLLKDINPFLLERRKSLPILKEWISMPEKEFLDKIKSTLIKNTERFMCGKEVKKDCYFFTLRSIQPPFVRKFGLKPQDKINDDFILNNLKLNLLPGAPENSDIKIINSNSVNVDSIAKSKYKSKSNEDSSLHDIYEFDDTSEDEIPIKQILDKAKKSKISPFLEKTRDEHKICKNMSITTLEKMDVEDDNANDTLINEPSEQSSGKMSILSTSEEKKQICEKDGSEIIPLKCSFESNNKCNAENTLSLNEKKSLSSKDGEKSSRKRKAFTSSKSYNPIRLIDSSSDENSSSSSRGTSLDLIIPPPKNFLGQNNPFRIISPKKNITNASTSTISGKKSVSFGIFNTTALNFSSKLAALKSAGLFPNLSTSNLAKAAGQPRTVRTIKRRLSAKDITIGPNKEVRRRRTRRLSSNIEIISTTTINPIPTNFFPIQAKDLLAAAAASTTTAASLFTTTQTKTSLPLLNNNITSTSASSSPNTESATTDNGVPPPATTLIDTKPMLTHGRRLRQRPQKNSPNTSRRSSISSNQSSSSSTSAAVGSTVMSANSQTSSINPHQSHEDLKQTVNKYFGIVNRIESGEQFSIRAKRQLANGQMQYLIEWGDAQNGSSTTPQNTQNHLDSNMTNTGD